MSPEKFNFKNTEGNEGEAEVKESKDNLSPEQAKESKENESIVLGKELKNKILAGIGMMDNEKFVKHFKKEGIDEYEIYKYVDSPEIGLLALADSATQKRIFDEFVVDNKELKGGFWSDSEVRDETKLEKITGFISEKSIEFKPGDKVRLTDEKIRQLREKGYMVGFPQTTGIITSIYEDMMSVEFGHAVRSVEKKDVKRIG